MVPPIKSVTLKIIYIDIDDTLLRSFGSKRIPMTHMVSLVRQLKDHGATLYCWSSGGAEYARSSADELGIVDCFAAFLPKPQILIDDVSIHDWTLAEIHPNECHSITVPELLERSET